MSTLQNNSSRLEVDCQQAVADIRSSLIELYAVLDADPALPQEISRRFNLNKNLTWKVSKVIQTDDGFGAIQHLPGAAGWEILLSAFHSAGAPKVRIEAVRSALRAFEDFVQLHAGDRAQLELILDSMGASGNGGQLEQSRAMAYQGNSGIWGVQARARLSQGYVVPSKTDDSKVDVALVGGMIGFRRLRPTVSWPLFRFQLFDENGNERPRNMEEFEDKKPGDVPRLLRQFCSPNLPEIQTKQVGSGMEYILPSGPIGNTASFSCFLGDLIRNENRYWDPKEEHIDFVHTVPLPVENLIFDVFMHRDLKLPSEPEVMLYGWPSGRPDNPLSGRPEHVLPISEKLVEFAGRPPAVATPLVPRCAELMQLVCRRLEVSPMDMRGYRIVCKYPPMGSTMICRWLLEKR